MRGVTVSLDDRPLLLPTDLSSSLSLHLASGDLTLSLSTPSLTLTVGQEHLRAVTELAVKVTSQDASTAPPLPAESSPTTRTALVTPGVGTPERTTPGLVATTTDEVTRGAPNPALATRAVCRHFTTRHHDDIRSSGYQFKVQDEESSGRIEAETVLITPSTITWR